MYLKKYLIFKDFKNVVKVAQMELTVCVRVCVSAAESFSYKSFFQKCGLASKSIEDLKKAFAIIDQDNSGFIEEEELK